MQNNGKCCRIHTLCVCVGPDNRSALRYIGTLPLAPKLVSFSRECDESATVQMKVRQFRQLRELQSLWIIFLRESRGSHLKVKQRNSRILFLAFTWDKKKKQVHFH